MARTISSRALVLIISITSSLTSLVIIVLGVLLTRNSRSVSGNIGLRIYQIYGDSILDGIEKLLPNIPGKESLIRELGIVIHDVLVNDIGDTLNSTIFSVGVLLVILACSQLLANSVLLVGASLRVKRCVPNVLLTRIFYFSTFWGSIDAYRKYLSSDEMSVFLV